MSCFFLHHSSASLSPLLSCFIIYLSPFWLSASFMLISLSLCLSLCSMILSSYYFISHLFLPVSVTFLIFHVSFLFSSSVSSFSSSLSFLHSYISHLFISASPSLSYSPPLLLTTHSSLSSCSAFHVYLFPNSPSPFFPSAFLGGHQSARERVIHLSFRHPSPEWTEIYPPAERKERKKRCGGRSKDLVMGGVFLYVCKRVCVESVLGKGEE